MQRIAIIGAGIAGLTLAQRLQPHAHVCVFDKARGVGGRLATRYNELGHQFDVGAQFFTAKTQAFSDFLKPYHDQGVIEPWHARFVEIDQQSITHQQQWSDQPAHWVATPKMTSLCKAMAAAIDVKLATRITSLQRDKQHYHLHSDAGDEFGPFDQVLFALPIAQTLELLPETTAFLPAIRPYRLSACFSLLLGFATAVKLPFDLAVVKSRDISLIANNTSKPGRSQHAPSITVLATNAYADQHLEDNPEQIQAHLWNELNQTLQRPLPEPNYQHLHRWRYANCPQQNGPLAFYDPELQIGVCGDWVKRGIVEAAFQSAMQLASLI